MIKIPDDRMFSENHLWVKKDKKKIVKIGITDYFHLKNLEIIDIDLPEEEEEFEKDEIFGSIETIEEVFDLVMPISGKVIAVNEKVLENTDVLNEDPYDEGWLLKVQISNPSELEDLLPPEDYEAKYFEEIEEILPEKLMEEEE
ncbi:MAG: glycine cleavage system protein GcvH [Thermodesulfobacteriaceae bacterium]|nr:glycine cleavage system protein GcvH [Thermodesulfobacteriaceae bacterium]MDW8135268.1 glycine cleavage system protein GcvH [Thermodesulfobacterium sp.]